MGLLNIFSKWKITCIILFPVQKDSELVSLFILYKTMNDNHGHTSASEDFADSHTLKNIWIIST